MLSVLLTCCPCYHFVSVQNVVLYVFGTAMHMASIDCAEHMTNVPGSCIELGTQMPVTVYEN